MASKMPPGFSLETMAVLDNEFIPEASDADRASVLDFENLTVDAYWALQNLSTSFNSHLSGIAIDVCLDYEFAFLRRGAQDMINIETTRLDGIFHATARTKADKEKQAKKAKKATKSLEEQFYNRISSFPYTIMPVNTGGHWVAVLIGLEPEAGKQTELYTHVRYLTVMDPAQQKETYAAVEGQLRLLLGPQGFSFEPCPRRDIETLPQRDEHSCGLHVYQIIKTVLHRIEDISHAGVAWDHETLWAPMGNGKRFVAEKVRAKMRGIAAEVFLRDCGGLVRPVFVPTSGVAPYDKKAAVKAASILYPHSHYHPRMWNPEGTGEGKRKRNTDESVQEDETPVRPKKRAAGRRR